MATAKNLKRLELQALIWSKEHAGQNDRLLKQLGILERSELLTVNYALFERYDAFAKLVPVEHVEIPENLPWERGRFERWYLEQENDMKWMLRHGHV